MSELEWMDNPKISDVNLVSQAIRKGWGVTDEQRAAILQKSFKKATDDTTTAREFNAIARLFISFDQVDIAREKLELEKAKLGENSTDDILELAREIKKDDPA